MAQHDNGAARSWWQQWCNRVILQHGNDAVRYTDLGKQILLAHNDLEKGFLINSNFKSY